MRLRNWLITGSSLSLLVLAPISVVKAQDAALIAAYEQFVVASSSGDADATTLAQNAFLAECARVGVPDAEQCIALVQSAGAPAEQPAPVEEQPAPVEEQPAPVEEQPAPVEEQPAPVEEQPAPVEEQPAPVEEQPAPAEEQPAPEVIEEPAPEAEPMTVEEQPVEEQPAPVEEQPAPAEEQPAPAEEQPAAVDISASLQAALDEYNQGIADLLAGGDAAAAQARIDAARDQIAELCAEAGYASTDECLADYGVTLPEVPAVPQQPEEQPVPAEEQPQAEETEPEVPTTVEEAQQQPVTEQAVEVIPEANVAPEEVAPLLDSAKDEEVAVESGEAPAPEVAPPTEPVAPPPQDDAAAQAKIALPAEEVVSVAAEQGQALAEPPPVVVPQNVTIINNNTTVINNNTTVNNTTNNTTNNNTTNNNVTNNIVNNQILVQVGAQIIIQNPVQERDRFVRADEDEVYYEQLSRGRVRETIERPDGSRIVTIRNRNGDILQRSRFTPEGREIVLAYFDDRYDDDLLEWRDPARDLPPLRLNIPVRDYVLDVSRADDEEVEVFFRQPPVEQVRRIYSIDEVKRSARIRDSVRRIEVGGLTFDTGAATISRDQVGALSKVANAMLNMLENNPAETFLIEGHSDAVGSDIANLKLSDLRAATVARILTDFYDIPPENLVTQGYGERYLKIKTEAAERLNRRVTIRRITPLITPVASR